MKRHYAPDKRGLLTIECNKGPIEVIEGKVGKWWSEVADVTKCGMVMKDTIFPWMKEKGVKSVGMVAFCWGGLCAITHAKSEMASAAVSIHGARLTTELMEQSEIPIAIMPGCGDADFRPFQEVPD